MVPRTTAEHPRRPLSRDDVLGLVGQMRGTVLHLGDAAVLIGRRLPLPVGYLLVLPLCIEAATLLIGRILDALFGPGHRDYSHHASITRR